MATNSRSFVLVCVLVLVAALAYAQGKSEAKEERQLPDGWITTKVKASILAVSVNQGVHVHVHTTDGNVRLEGAVPNPSTLDSFRKAALRIYGVKSLDTTALVVTASQSP